jgi:predicted chitinase
VQLTWYENYEKFGKLLKIDLLENPSLALSLSVSTKIMFAGMTRGLFTGVNLARYFNDQREDWLSARKIINGMDKAELIANYGKKFLNCVT